MVLKNPFKQPKRFEPRDTSDWPAELFTLPGHPALRSQLAPHETAGILRVHRAGTPGGKLAVLFKLPGVLLMRALQSALDQEGVAHQSGREIHDDTLTKKAAAEYLEGAA